MSGKQLRDIRTRMELTQGQLASRLRTTLNTVARWERSEVEISGPVSLLIELFAREAGVESASAKRRVSNHRRSRRAAQSEP